MNKWIVMGRVTKDIEESDVRYVGGDNATCIANFNIAVDKRFKKKDDPDAPTADFFRFTAIGKLGEFVSKYLHKGTKILVEGRVENNNYTNKDGQKVYGFQFIAENIEFAESKKAAEANGTATDTNDKKVTGNEDWMQTQEELIDSLPFK